MRGRFLYADIKYMLFLLFVLSIFPTLHAKESKQRDYVYIDASRHVGMGYIFYQVFPLIAKYEEGYIGGLHINFGKTGCYYDPEYGENWWEYYFEPICMGRKKNTKKVHIKQDSKLRRYNKKVERRKLDISTAVRKYVRLRPLIQKEVDCFVLDNFTGYFVLGVHYRGTDKQTEAARATYEEVIEAVEQQIQKIEGMPYKIFVATDEEPFLDRMKALFGSFICYNENVLRSRDESCPLHYTLQQRPYEVGKSAVVDCILLSKTDFLIKTISNLSDASLVFNPNLPWIQLPR